MGGKPRATCPPEQILEGFSPRVVALAGRARRMVRGMIDGVIEEGDPGRGVIRLSRHGRFGFIQPMPDHIRLGFEHGAALPDFGGVLEAQGRGRVRYAAVRSARELGGFAIKTLISAALFDDETHGFRKRARRR
ncbi:MAG TPA: hypothetical protein VKZ63_03060 [Kofleriaceae bacterium]|nr:hypothetical protein [Kofleriaceae bacterium]